MIDQHLSVAINLAGVVDTTAELKKLQKELDNKKQYCEKLQATMNNPNYMKKPEAARKKDMDKYTEAAGILAQIEDQYQVTPTACNRNVMW